MTSSIKTVIMENGNMIFWMAPITNAGSVARCAVTNFIRSNLCRESGQERRIREIAKISNIAQKEIAKCYRMLVLGLDLKVPQADPIKCINIIANRGQLSEKSKRVAIKLMKKVVKTKISSGKDPMGLAASVLYMACLETGEAITQKELARTAGVIEVTVRNKCKNLGESLKLNYNRRYKNIDPPWARIG